MNQFKNIPDLLALSIIGVFALTVMHFSEPDISYAGTGENVRGYAWSDNIGWISFNSIEGGGSNYGVNVDLDTGLFSGYAWSSNVGWLSFNQTDLSGCPKSPCTTNYNQGNGKITGWARFLSANGSGWDGWLSLSGKADPPDNSQYGVSLLGNSFSGYAWGGEVVGWVSFNGVAGDGSGYGVTLGIPSTEVGLCSDGVDNDNDGPSDCGDSDCQGDPVCNSPYFSMSKTNDVFVNIVGAKTSAVSSETTLTVSPSNGFSGPITFSVEGGLPAGAVANFNPNPPVLSQGQYSSGMVFSVTVPNTAESGAYSILVRASGGNFVSQINVGLNVNLVNPIFEEI